ncbi:ATP-binding protein [Pseudomonas sichuanensis]|uniref:HD domain-containing protein n=1 Tax=Pseudomonas sichuanensis TaxID=2213015 RepID=UPI0038102BA6
MLELSAVVEKSNIWKNCFEQSDHKNDRERLKNSILKFRDRSAQLASEIRTDLPDLTIHDISHLDSLWETASQIVGENYPLTPTEVYVLGGAILLHDLAMSIAATPGGLEELKKTQLWSDTTHAKYKQRHKRPATPEEIRFPSEEIFKEVIFEILRKIHAESAEKLALTSFKYKKEQLHLIEDAELRLAYGGIIGEIAHSHWWSISEIERRFTETIGTPPWATANDWTVSPLKIACILRAADAAHLDARRAPIFTRTFRKLNKISAQHWDFQEKLLKPYLKEDALIFTSGQSFPFSEADSWWVCLDSLRMVDTELRGIDALLSDQNIARFAAKRVAAIDNPDRLAKYIRTDKWHPINATVHISDIPSIIRSIGGEELYGANPAVPIRELIQNSCDAIRARRVYEDRPDNFGAITVSIEQHDEDYFLKIQDNGTGMSKNVLTNYLLDFGKSFWTSSSAQEEFPGLISSEFRSTGKYGIGFFSAFMISDQIKIITRHVDKAKSETIVVEFGHGLNGRPILRPATQEEFIRDGGTIISLKLNTPPKESGGLLHSSNRLNTITLAELCTSLAPAIDVDLYTNEFGKTEKTITANDWQTLSDIELLSRINNIIKKFRSWSEKDHDLSCNINMRPIYGYNDEVVGRACITTSTQELNALPGILTVGGLDSNYLSGITGILTGRALRASRDASDIAIPEESIAAWASEQAGLVSKIFTSPENLADCASYICSCGGDPGDLPVAQLNGKWLSFKELRSIEKSDHIIIVPSYEIKASTKNLEQTHINSNILIADLGGTFILNNRNRFTSHIEDNYFELNSSNFAHNILDAIATAWNIEPEELVDQYYDTDETEVVLGTHSRGEIKGDGTVLLNPLY